MATTVAPMKEQKRPVRRAHSGLGLQLLDGLAIGGAVRDLLAALLLVGVGLAQRKSELPI